MSHLEEGVVAARCELAGELDVAVQPAPGRDKTQAGEKRCLRDSQHPPLAQTPSRTLLEGAHCPPMGHSRPEVLHSAELGDKAQVCLPHLALVILEEPQCPPGEGREMGGGGGKPVCQTCWSPPSDPTPHSQCWERLPIARSPIPVLQGVLAQAFCQEHLLLLNPSPPALPLLLPALGKEGQPQGAPQPPQQGACDPPQPPPHRNTNPTAGSPEGTAGCPWLCWQAQPTGRGLTCSPVAILASPDSP